MTDKWKLTSIGLAVALVTAPMATLTTAYVMGHDANATPEVSTPREVGASIPRTTAAPRPSVTRTSVTPIASRPTVTPVRVATPVSTDCATGGDRAWRIAKPGIVAGVLGAGVGAAGGAIANGGKGAGKGALIGALVGTTAGAAYGAYKTKNECGTIFGDGASLGLPLTDTVSLQPAALTSLIR
jgi:hypothetical protein